MVELASMLRFFVKRGGSVWATVRKETYRASNLEQGDLEVPVTVLCSVSSEKGKIGKQLKELLKERQRYPRDEKDNTRYITRKKLT